MSDDNPKLTAKQQRFIQEYLIDFNATQAAIRAGYNKKTAGVIGNENLKKPYIKSAIEKKMAEIESAKIADAKEVREFWTSVMRGEKKETVLCMVGGGAQEPIEIPVNMNGRLKAAEFLGKTNGMFKETVNIESNELSKLDEMLKDISEAAKK